MNVMIAIEDPNEIQCNLIHLIQIQDEIKKNKRDREETEKIKETITRINKIRSEPGTGTGGN